LLGFFDRIRRFETFESAKWRKKSAVRGCYPASASIVDDKGISLLNVAFGMGLAD